ncbi:MAG TPA: hypothetical protein VJ736_06725 [Actinomycetota bacterium]|nr:hypothetical protein [Actinomycetota bacterium]
MGRAAAAARRHGVGIAALALGASGGRSQTSDEWSRVFFDGSIAGFVTVAAGLALLIARSNRFERMPVPPRIDD